MYRCSITAAMRPSLAPWDGRCGRAALGVARCGGTAEAPPMGGRYDALAGLPRLSFLFLPCDLRHTGVRLGACSPAGHPRRENKGG
jgi:hypothetical protein